MVQITAKDGRFTQALKYLKIAQEKKIPLDSYPFNTLVNYAAKAKNKEVLHKVLEEMSKV